MRSLFKSQGFKKFVNFNSKLITLKLMDVQELLSVTTVSLREFINLFIKVINCTTFHLISNHQIYSFLSLTLLC